MTIRQTHRSIPDIPEPFCLEDFAPLVYGELRSIAGRFFKCEPQHHTLQPTALVHEVFVRLALNGPEKYMSRAYFFAVAGRAMRQILVEAARKRNAQRRGRDWQRVPLDGLEVACPELPDYLAIDFALEGLSNFDPQLAQIAELRVFAGLWSKKRRTCWVWVLPPCGRVGLLLAPGWEERSGALEVPESPSSVLQLSLALFTPFDACRSEAAFAVSRKEIHAHCKKRWKGSRPVQPTGLDGRDQRSFIGATGLRRFPWENAVDALMRAFTGPIARGLSLVAVVVGGLMWAFGESDKRMLAGITFGIGMALGSASFIAWLFP